MYNLLKAIIISGILSFSLVSSFATGSISLPEASKHLSEEDVYLQQADSVDRFISAERWEEAESVMERMLRQQPGNAMNTMVISNLANVKFMLGKYEESADLADIALARAQNSATLHNLKGKALIADNRQDEGVRELELSLACDSLQSWPNLVVGAISLNNGNLQKAERHLKRAYELDPETPESALPYADLCAMTNRIEKGIEIYETFKLDKIGDEAAGRYVQMLLENGNFEKGNKVIRDAIDIFPTSGNLYVLRAVFYNLSHQKSDAEIALKLAKKYSADPQFIEFYFPKKRK